MAFILSYIPHPFVFLILRQPPASASQSAGVTAVLHQAQPNVVYCKEFRSSSWPSKISQDMK